MKGNEERRAIITLDKLNTYGRIEVDRDELRAAVRTAKAALAKRIPLRAGVEGNDDQDCYLCPSCQAPVGVADAIDLTDDYCYSCGQALDWDSFI